MAVVVRMPGVSADADAATLVEWAVAVGDSIAEGEVIATVETDKAVVDLESDSAGVLMRTFAEAGESVNIGGPLAVLIEDGESAEDEAAILAELGLGVEGGALEDGAPEPEPLPSSSVSSVAKSMPPPTPAASPALGAPASAGQDAVVQPVTDVTGPTDRIFATPLVRRLALAAGVPLSALTGTGPGGRIRRRDLEAHLASAGAAAHQGSEEAVEAPRSAETNPVAVQGGSSAAGWSEVPVTRFRRAVASALTRSKQEVPHFYLKATCRAEALLELRHTLNADGATTNGKVTVNDFVVKAAAIALSRVPEMNVSWAGDTIRQFEQVDVAVAMATERGLVVPVVRSADSRSLSDLSTTIKDLASRATSNSLQQRELEGGALAISNLGMFGVQEFAAIINPPQVGILAVGAISPQAVESADGQLELARCLTVVLSADHRPVDGALAARWLAQFKTLIENPLQILL